MGDQALMDEVTAEIKAVCVKLEEVEEEIKQAQAEHNNEEVAALRKKEEQLRKKEEQLRTEKEQLRKKEEQLREEKLLLLRSTQGELFIYMRSGRAALTNQHEFLIFARAKTDVIRCTKVAIYLVHSPCKLNCKLN